VKNIIKSVFSRLGFDVRRKKNKVHGLANLNDKMLAGLKRFKALNIQCNTIIDIGAAEGSWSLTSQKLWPECSYLMFEPLEERKDLLENLCREHSNFHYVPMAAGKERTTIQFIISPDLDGSGVAPSGTQDHQIRSVDVSSIDEEVKTRGLSGPYLIKLDTHGFEVPILEGCSAILKDVELFIIECYGFQIADNSLLFWEMCQYMDRLGYRLYDLVDVMNRPKDGAFWQCDAFFVRKSNTFFKYNHYQ
jgi:FkbM family methyltransferase